MTKLKSRFEQWQSTYSMVGNIRGLGAMLGFELVKGPDQVPAADEARQLLTYCNENGLVLLVCGIYGNVVRCLAPFVITDEQLEKGFSILEVGLDSIHKSV